MAARKSPSPSAAPPAEPVPEPAPEPVHPPTSASSDTAPLPSWAPGDTAGELVTVFVTNGVRVSTGETTPGLVHVPPAEASALIANRVAVGGTDPPRNWSG